jgi:hypothetical protein
MYKAVLANNPAKTVKLTPTSSDSNLAVTPLVGRYAAIRRRCAQTARISLHEPISLKELSSDKIPRGASFLAYPRLTCLQNFRVLSLACAAVRSRHRHVSASVSGYLRRAAASRKREKHKPAKIFHISGKRCEIGGLAQEVAQEEPRRRNFVTCHERQSRLTHRLRPQPAPAIRPSGSAAPPADPAPMLHRSTHWPSRPSPAAKDAERPPPPPHRQAGADGPKP